METWSSGSTGERSERGQPTLIARPGELSRHRGLRAVVLAPAITEPCRDCGSRPSLVMWKVCRTCWDASRARHAEPAELGLAA